MLGRRGLTVERDQRGRHGAVGPARPLARTRPCSNCGVDARHDRLPAYASRRVGRRRRRSASSSAATWTPGSRGVKMRVGVMDGDVATSVARVRAAREGARRRDRPDGRRPRHVRAADAIAFARAVEPCRIRWFEEPVSSDDRAGGSTCGPPPACRSRQARASSRGSTSSTSSSAGSPTCSSPISRSAAGRPKGGGSRPSPRATNSSWRRTAGARRCRSPLAPRLAFASPAAQ